MKTIKAITLIAWAFFVASFLSCAPKAYSVGSPNPLDEPGYAQPTAEQLHAKNIAKIKGTK